MFRTLIIFILITVVSGCGMSSEQRDFVKRLGKASSCLTLEGCQGQPRYDNPRAGKYQSAITIRSTDICPIDARLGSYSHSTSSGLNRICYYT